MIIERNNKVKQFTISSIDAISFIILLYFMSQMVTSYLKIWHSIVCVVMHFKNQTWNAEFFVKENVGKEGCGAQD